jgi:transcriptional regulator with XRE-family HTH domain
MCWYQHHEAPPVRYCQVLKPTRQKHLNVAGPAIRTLRLKRGWSQAQLAAKCQLAGWDISRDTVANLELRRRWLADFELMDLAAVLGIEVRELLPQKR